MTTLHNRIGLFLIIKGIEETCPRKQTGTLPFHSALFEPLSFVFRFKFTCKHYALLPHGGELVSDMSHIATSAQNRADASTAGGQHAAFAFSTRNQEHLFSNPGMLSNLVLRHWHVYRV